MKTLDELRQLCADAVERMQDALKAVENPQEGADEAALRAKFDEAKAEHATAVEAYDRAKALAEARSSLPVEPVVETETEERKDPARPREEVRESELTYQKHGENSILRDLRLSNKGDSDARERLARHMSEMVEIRAINKTDGEGGEFIPPLWLQNEWIKLPRASRPVANSLNKMPLPPGTDTINIPKVETGTAVAVQTDGGAVKAKDLKTTSVTAAVQTVAGQQDVSQQLVDLSVPGIEVVIFDDLTRAYDTEIDVLSIAGTVTNAKGLNEVAGTNSITYTETTPKVGKAWSKIASAIAEVNAGIFLPPTVIAMHPIRWAWLLAAVDANERPLIVPVGQPGFNAVGLQERVAAENIVGSIMGIPVIVDASIPATKGAGTNQDEIYVYRAENIYLWEGTPKLRVFEEVLSNTLQVRFQLYGYYAVAAGRLPKSISKIGGTGLAAPTF